MRCGTDVFERTAVGPRGAHYLAEVVSVSEFNSTRKIQVRLHSYDAVTLQDAVLSARVAVPFAGPSKGAFLLPDVGDEVVLAFVNHDVRFPVVVGGLWNGRDAAPETLGGDGVDRWTITGKKGTRIAIVESDGGQPTIECSTPGGPTATITDDGGGKIELRAAGSTITIDSSGVTVETSSEAKVTAGTVTVEAGNVKVDAPAATFTGLVKCEVLKATTVAAEVYTPGAGNIW